MMKNPVDKTFYDELAELRPEKVCQRARCRYDNEKKCYGLSVWGDEYDIYPHESRVHPRGQRLKPIHDYFYVFIVHYLLGCKAIETADEWVSEKDIPGGAAFFRGVHALPTHLIAGSYEGHIEAFGERCRHLGGVPLEMADAAYAFEITPRIPVAVLYWEKDDDFPAESKLLFDPTISEHLALDAIFALAVEVCARIGNPKVNG